jgi:hypothetical protein
MLTSRHPKRYLLQEDAKAMKQRLVVSILRGPGVAEAQMASSNALVNVNGNYLDLDENALLTLAELVAAGNPHESVTSSAESPSPDAVCCAGRL